MSTLDTFFNLPVVDKIVPLVATPKPETEFLSFDVRTSYVEGRTYIRDSLPQEKKPATFH